MQTLEVESNGLILNKSKWAVKLAQLSPFIGLQPATSSVHTQKYKQSTIHGLIVSLKAYLNSAVQTMNVQYLASLSLFFSSHKRSALSA